MALNVLLSAGSGAVADAFDLTPYIVQQGISAPPPEPGERTRVVELALDIVAADADALWTAWGGVEAKLIQARQATGVYGAGAGVTLSVQLDTTEWVYLDVVDGTLALDTLGILSFQSYAVLSLVCLPYGRGDTRPATLSPDAAIVNGETVYVADIPGTAPALARLTIEDSGSAAVNGVQVFSHSRYGLESADYDPVIEFSANGAATTLSDATASGGDCVRGVSDITWQTVATAARPTTDTTGAFSPRLRVRDASGTPAMPENVQAAVTAGIFITGVVTSAGAGSTTTTTVITVDGRSPNSIPAGAVLELEIASTNAATISSIGGIGGGTWTLASDGTDDARVVNGTAAQINVYWLRTTTAITSQVNFTVTWGATKGTVQFFMHRMAGLVASGNPVEQVAADTTGTASTVAPAGVTTTQAYQLATYAIATADVESFGSATNSFSASGGTRLFYGNKTLTAAGAVSAPSRTTTVSGTAVYAATLVTYKAASSAVGSIGTGTWNLRVASEGSAGALSAATTAVSVSVSAATDTVTVSWDTAVGASTGYRVYRDRGTGWAYFSTTATSYTFTTESGITTGTPPSTGSGGTPSDIRLAVVTSDGQTIGKPTRSARPILANGQWEALSFPFVALPPNAALDGADNDDWLLAVQIRNDTAGVNVDIDIAWLLRRGDPSLITEYAPGDLATGGDWVIETRRDGVTSARLYQAGTTTMLAPVTPPLGELLIGPGSAVMGVRLMVAGGASDVVNATADLTLLVTPRYTLLPGVGP